MLEWIRERCGCLRLRDQLLLHALISYRVVKRKRCHRSDGNLGYPPDLSLSGRRPPLQTATSLIDHLSERPSQPTFHGRRRPQLGTEAFSTLTPGRRQL